MKVLIYEPRINGHYLSYASLCAKSISGECEEVFVCLSEIAEKSDSYKVNFSDLPNNIACSFISNICLNPIKLNTIIFYRSCLKELLNLKIKYNADSIIVPYADGMSQAAVFLSSRDRRMLRDSQVIMMRGAFAYASHGIKEFLKAELSYWMQRFAPWGKVFHLDPIVYSEVIKRGGAYARKSFVIPEPIEEFSSGIDLYSICEKYHIDRNKKIISCLGSHTFRKGTDLLIKAFVKIASDDCILVIAGKILDKNIHDLLVEFDDKRIIVIDEYISNTDFEGIFQLSDIVAVPYPRHIGSSGILVRAAKYKKPVIASNFGWIGWVVEQFKLGYTCDVTDIQTFSNQLKILIDQSFKWVDSSQRERFVKYHTYENQSLHLISYYTESVSKNKVSWEDVLGI